MPRDTVEELDFTSYRVEQPVTDGVLRVLIEARALLSDPARWCKESRYEGSAMCTWGAISRISGKWDDPETEGLLSDVAIELNPECWGYIEFNDAPSTTHADVMALFDRAISRRRSEIGA
jgi:hypothetical protein